VSVLISFNIAFPCVLVINVSIIYVRYQINKRSYANLSAAIVAVNLL
jgi:hypothetical protein